MPLMLLKHDIATERTKLGSGSNLSVVILLNLGFHSAALRVNIPIRLVPVISGCCSQYSHDVNTANSSETSSRNE